MYPLVRPVRKKVASIIACHIDGYHISDVALVGGSSAFHRAGEVVSEYTGLPAWVPVHPEPVILIGIGMHNTTG